MRYREETDYSESPFGVYGPARRHVSAVQWLIIVNVVLYLVQAVVRVGGGGDALLLLLGLSRGAAFGHGFVWQFVTYAFLHGGISHILFNMLFLYWFGREIEQVWGWRRFLLFYLAAAAFAGALFAGSDYFLRPQQPSLCIGASGAVMACLMVYALWWPDRIILLMFLFPIRIRTFVLITIGIEILGLLEVSRSHGVANMAHLGGLLFGWLVLRGGPTMDRLAERFSRVGGRDSAADQRRLDELLDKVHRRGIQSLTWRERRFLKRFSAHR